MCSPSCWLNSRVRSSPFFLFATGLSFFLHDPVNVLIILTIVLISGLLGFWQEHSATNAVEKLQAVVQIKAAVLRDGSRNSHRRDCLRRHRHSKRRRYRPRRLSGAGISRIPLSLPRLSSNLHCRRFGVTSTPGSRDALHFRKANSRLSSRPYGLRHSVGKLIVLAPVVFSSTRLL